MADEVTAAILFRLSRDRQARPQQDPADLGTAFGLDMSLDPACEPPPADEPEEPGWLERLGLKPPR
jgi:hypothetical protein